MIRLAVACALSILAWGAVLAAPPSLLVRVERLNDDDLTRLRSAGVPVVMETRPCLFVLGGEADVAALRARGYDVRVLDKAAATADYFIVGVRPDSDVAAVRAAGTVLLAEENWMLVRMVVGSPAHDALDAARVFVARVPRNPVGIPKPRPASVQSLAPNVPNPIVQKIVATVADADIQTYWQTLATNSPTGTRFSTSQGCRDAATYCFNTYTALKVPVEYQNWNAGNAPNVIGTLPGATVPGDVYIVIGHLDDLPSSGVAPGADDNASGSAAVLESAKALSCWGVRNTVKFLNVTGEEQGLFGSEAYAADAATRGENIRGVINFDMIGWAGDGIPATENLDLNYNAPSQWLAQRFVDAAATYATGLTVNPILCPSLTVSDHAPFWEQGWSAICGITDNEGFCGAAGNYPHYHMATDTIANNGNPAFFYKVVKTTVATLAEMGDPFKVTFSAGAYGCGAPIQVVLADRDLNTGTGTTQTVNVHVWSTSEPAGETLTLSERGTNSMIFDGSMPTTAAPPVGGDGLLSVAAGDTLHVEYVDALDCDGTNNVSYTATAGTDCVAPVISNVAASNVTGNSARITWNTNEPTTSVVHYGPTPPPTSTTGLAPLVLSHAVNLTGLAACSDYVYSVESADSVGNTAFDTNGGAYYAFTTGTNSTPTYPYTGSPVPIPDNNPVGATATIVVPDSKTILDLNVTVSSLTHTFDGDLVIHVIGPDNTDVILSNRRGGTGESFTDTVFDDAAATPIASGVAPFTGSFIPDGGLSAFNGKNSAGSWKIFVVDAASTDTGTIQSVSLNMTFASQPCNTPHAIYSANGSIADTCTTGGPGSGNAIWEAGEQVQFKINITSDGTAALTGVTATIVSTTPGVTMADGTASFPNLGVAASADSIAPHFTANLPTSLACGSLVAFDVTINADQGSWTGSFSRGVGQVLSGNGTALNETFAGGIPATWTVVNGGVGGAPAAATWTAANPGARTIAAPMAAPVVIVDSDNAGSAAGILQDEELISPVMNLGTATGVTLQFDQFFRVFTGSLVEVADVDVRSSLTAGAWVNVLRQQNASSPNPDHKTVNITAQAAGAANVQVRFHYYNAHFEWFWQVDNVQVDYVAPAGCNQDVCAAPPGVAKPVADGSYGTAMTGSRADSPGSTIDLTWDVSTCSSTDHHVLYGDLGSVASSTVTGSSCHLGVSGSATWTGVPGGNLWFVVVGDNDATTEGSWGMMTSGERGGAAASGQCGLTTRDNAGTCP